MKSARDLQTSPPRRWNEALGSVRWLPRLIDKTRAALAGTLGDYLFGQSPVDRALLRALALSHRDFAEIVREAPDDQTVLQKLAARDPQGLERARRWSAELPRRAGLFLLLLDIDDGYRPSPLRAPVKWCANAISRAAKRLWPSRAASRAASGNAAE